MHTMLLWSFPLPEESIVLLFQAAIGWKSSFLQCCYVNVEPLELSADDCCLPCVIDLLEIVGEARAHGPDIPSCQSQRWRL